MISGRITPVVLEASTFFIYTWIERRKERRDNRQTLWGFPESIKDVINGTRDAGSEIGGVRVIT
jgi:hypothetical protein